MGPPVGWAGWCSPRPNSLVGVWGRQGGPVPKGAQGARPRRGPEATPSTGPHNSPLPRCEPDQGVGGRSHNEGRTGAGGEWGLGKRTPWFFLGQRLSRQRAARPRSAWGHGAAENTPVKHHNQRHERVAGWGGGGQGRGSTVGRPPDGRLAAHHCLGEQKMVETISKRFFPVIKRRRSHGPGPRPQHPVLLPNTTHSQQPQQWMSRDTRIRSLRGA